jgi:hypothetical protein
MKLYKTTEYRNSYIDDRNLKNLEKEFKKRGYEGLSICTVFPVSEIFRPTEKVLFQVLSIGFIKTCKLVLFNQFQKEIDEKEVTLSKEGMAFVEWDAIPAGEYFISIVWEDLLISNEVQFQTAEYQRSLLVTELIDSSITESGNTKFKVSVNHFPKTPYEGEIFVKIQYASFSSLVKKGIWEIESDFLPLVTEISDPLGNQSKIVLSGESNLYNSLFYYGNKSFSYSVSKPDAGNIIGQMYGWYFYYVEKTLENTEDEKPSIYDLFTLENALLENGEDIVLTANFTPEDDFLFYIYTSPILDSFDSVQKYEFTNLRKGQKIYLKAGKVLTFLRIKYKTLGGKYFLNLTSGTIFTKQKKFDLSIEKKELIELNKSISLQINSNLDSEVTYIFKPKITRMKSALGEFRKSILLANKFDFDKILDIYDQEESKKNIKKRLILILKFILKVLLFFPYYLYKGIKTIILRIWNTLQDNEQSEFMMMREASLSGSNYSGDEFYKENNLEQVNTEESRKFSATLVDFGMVSLEKEKPIEILLPAVTDIGEYELVLFGKSGFSVQEEKISLLCDIPDRMIITSPEFVSTSGSSTIEAIIETENSNLDFIIKDSSNQILKKEIVNHKNRILTEMDSRGKYSFELSKEGKILDTFEINLKSIWEEEILAGKLHILKEGESITGKLFVYGNLSNLLQRICYSIMEYPFGCLEQILCKISVLGLAYQGMEEGKISEKEKWNQKFLQSKINLLKDTYEQAVILGKFEELLGWFESSTANVHITAQCLLHLEPFYKTKLSFLFLDLESIAIEMIKTLKKYKYKDNRLLVFDFSFKEEEISSPESAAGLLFIKKERAKAIEYLKTKSKTEGRGTYWEGISMAGKSQTTAYVARCIFDYDEELSNSAREFIFNQLYNEKLFSTSDSKELFHYLIKSGESLESSSKIDGIFYSNLKEVKMAENIEVEKGEVLVRETFRRKINYSEFKKSDLLRIEKFPEKIPLLSSFHMELSLDSSLTGCLVAKVRTTGKLGFSNGNLNQSEKEIPIFGKSLYLNLQALRKGNCDLIIIVYDLYNSDRIFTTGLLTVEII